MSEERSEKQTAPDGDALASSTSYPASPGASASTDNVPRAGAIWTEAQFKTKQTYNPLLVKQNTKLGCYNMQKVREFWPGKD